MLNTIWTWFVTTVLKRNKKIKYIGYHLAVKIMKDRGVNEDEFKEMISHQIVHAGIETTNDGTTKVRFKEKEIVAAANKKKCLALKQSIQQQ